MLSKLFTAINNWGTPIYRRNWKVGCQSRYDEHRLCSLTRSPAKITVSRACLNDTSRPGFLPSYYKLQSDVYFCFEIIPCSSVTHEIIISLKRNCVSRRIFISYDRTLLLALIRIIHGVKIKVKDKVQPRTCHECPEREQTYSSTLYFASALHVGGYLI